MGAEWRSNPDKAGMVGDQVVAHRCERGTRALGDGGFGVGVTDAVGEFAGAGRWQGQLRCRELVVVLGGVLGAPARLRTGEQVRRLLWAVTVPAVLIGWYGIGQHFGIDFLRANGPSPSRIPLTFGNAVFGAAYLILTIPVTLALWQGWRERYRLASHIAIGGTLISLQAAAIAFTLSRGSMFALVAALAAFLAVAAWSMGRDSAKAPAGNIAIALAFALIMSYVPVPGEVDTSGQLDDRLLSVGSAFTSEGGGLSGRFTIWDVSLDAYVTCLGSTQRSSTICRSCPGLRFTKCLAMGRTCSAMRCPWLGMPGCLLGPIMPTIQSFTQPSSSARWD
jgi:hypothetical protein